MSVGSVNKATDASIIPSIFFFILIVTTALFVSEAEAAAYYNSQSGKNTLSIRKSAVSPNGFSSVCSRYSWACASRSGRVGDSARTIVPHRLGGKNEALVPGCQVAGSRSTK